MEKVNAYEWLNIPSDADELTIANAGQVINYGSSFKGGTTDESLMSSKLILMLLDPIKRFKHDMERAKLDYEVACQNFISSKRARIYLKRYDEVLYSLSDEVFEKVIPFISGEFKKAISDSKNKGFETTVELYQEPVVFGLLNRSDVDESIKEEVLLKLMIAYSNDNESRSFLPQLFMPHCKEYYGCVGDNSLFFLHPPFLNPNKVSPLTRRRCSKRYIIEKNEEKVIKKAQ